MPAFRGGPNTYLEFDDGANPPVVLSLLKWRNFDYDPQTARVDSSGGPDTFRTTIPGLEEEQELPVEWVLEDNDTTMTNAAMVKGTTGNLIYGPFGNAAGKKRFTIPVRFEGFGFSAPYDDVVMGRAKFTQIDTAGEDTFPGP